MANILKEAEEGNLKSQAELFQDMEERDAHLFAEMSKRKRAVIELNWSIEPPFNATPQEKADAEFLSDALRDMDGLEDLFLDRSRFGPQRIIDNMDDARDDDSIAIS